MPAEPNRPQRQQSSAMAALDLEVADLHGRLSAVKKARRKLHLQEQAVDAGLASGRARRAATEDRNRRIVADYRREVGGRLYFSRDEVIKIVARCHGVSSRTVYRVIAQIDMNR